MRAQTKMSKLIKHVFSAVIVCSNLCVGPLARIKITFFLIINMFIINYY